MKTKVYHNKVYHEIKFENNLLYDSEGNTIKENELFVRIYIACYGDEDIQDGYLMRLVKVGKSYFIQRDDDLSLETIEDFLKDKISMYLTKDLTME